LSGKLTLIGPRALGPEGFFLGPYFTYLLAPFYLLTKLHPGAMVFFIIVYNLAFFALTFLVLREFFGYSTALIFLLIWSLHPALIGIDLIAWNPLLVPLVVIAIWGLFFLTFRKLPLYIWLAVGILVGLGINFHFQLLFLTPFALVFLFSQRKDLIKRLAVFLGGIAFCFLPLLAFDLRHNFLNSKLFLDFLSGEGKGVDYFAWFPVWKNVTVALIGIDAKIIPLAFYFLVLVLVILGWKKEKKREHRHFFLAFLLLWLFFPFGFSIFGRRPSEYYFNFLRPFLVFLFTYFLLKVIKNWQIVFLLVLLSFFPKVDQLKEGLQPNPLGLFYKEKVVQRISDIGRGRKFNVSFSIGRYCKINSSMAKPFLTIVIPCYNEEKNLRRGVLDQVEKYLKKQDYASKVIISDDGSIDGSIKFVEKFAKYHPRFKLLKNKHGGKPYAVKAGIMEAKGEITLFTDMDQSTPLKEIEKLFPYFKKSYDVVIGSRGTVRKGAPWYRKILAKGFLFIRRLLIVRKVVDTQCGFKAFKNKVARDLFRSLKIYGPQEKEVKGGRVTAFDVELLFLAEKKGYKIAEVPVEWGYEAAKRVNYLKESYLMAKEIFRVRFNDWRGIYD